ncbi:hypothetical protein DFH29DRAFT_815965 [Suillus ampliporus]|nr:hypothetical protein DFH29DRAFT_815965 [Suillus ampliporus]
MPKRALGNLKNLGAYATRNTKKTRLNQAQAKDKENVQVSFELGDTTHFPRLTSLSASHRSRRFMDAYKKGLTGKQAAWASKKYRGHRVLPHTILAELEKAGL